jgi:hypothetical protein
MAKRISPDEASKLYNNYDDKHTILSKLIKKDDSRSLDLTIQELEDYITYLKKENAGIDGIRIYFGSYSNESGPNGKSSNNLTTVFLAPTEGNKNDLSLDVLNYVDPTIPPKKYK